MEDLDTQDLLLLESNLNNPLARRNSDGDSYVTVNLNKKSNHANKRELEKETPELQAEPILSERKKRRIEQYINDSITARSKLHTIQISKGEEKENSRNVRTGPKTTVDDFRDLEEDPCLTVRYRRVLKLIPDVPFITVSTHGGSRVYLRLLSDKKRAEKEKILLDKPKRNLLGRDFYELKEEATQKLNEHKQKLENQTVERVLEKSKDSSALENGKGLWVDKYKPNGYLDLISDEQMNRNLLHWIKIWDKIVFGIDYLAKVKETKERWASLESKENERENKHKILIEDDAYDVSGRPKQKVCLLYGPPGLGKTTAAHIIAKHAGYNVIEMNASDDRSVEIFKKVLDSTTESRSEYFSGGKPNCLIIDEIDGAPSATVNLLVDLVSGKAVEKGRSKNKKILKRPIICICNDLFANSLKNLRKIAFLLEFLPICVPNLVERMEEISLKEKFNVDSGTLRELCEKTECDIRSCLSTLQFLKRSKTRGDVSSLLSSVGKMDKNKGIFNVWHDIFIQPSGKSYYNSSDYDSPQKRFQNVLRTVQQFGDYDKLAAGVFENYLNVKFRDSYFRNIIEGLNWMVWFEDIRGFVERSQNYSSYGFLPIFFVVANSLFSSKNWVKLQYPNSEILSRTNKISALVKTQQAELNPNLGKYLDTTSLIIDVFPNLLTIIQPDTIRPVPTQLWSTQERETIKSIVELMITYNLNYVQTRTPEGSYAFGLEPDLDEISRYTSGDPSKKKQFPYTIKQLVAREIETEKLRRSEGDFDIRPSTPAAILPGPEAMLIDEEIVNPKSPSSVTDLIKKTSELSKGKFEDHKTAISKDFFGRVVIPSPRSSAIQEAKRIKDEKFDIWYRFKEGYSNAVRKNLKVKDFL